MWVDFGQDTDMSNSQSQNLVNQTQFAKLCKVSAEAIRKACASGKINIVGEGRKKQIDLNGELTIDYLHDKNSQRTKSPDDSENHQEIPPLVSEQTLPEEESSFKIASDVPALPKSSGSDLTNIDLDNLTDEDMLRLRPSHVKMLKDLETTLRTRQNRIKERGDLIDRKLVTKFLGILFTIERNEIVPISEKIPSEIAAILGVEDNELVLKIGKLLKDEFAKAFSHIEAKTQTFLTSINSDVQGENVSG